MGSISLAPRAENLIINPLGEIPQRGTSFPGIVNDYTLDRWLAQINGAAVFEVSRNTTVLPEAPYALRAEVTTADASLGASDEGNIQQRIEGYNARKLINQNAVIAFSVKSNVPGKHYVSLQNTAQDRSIVLEYTINQADTWEEKTLRVPRMDASVGTWDFTNGIGLRAIWKLYSGITAEGTSTLGEWQSGDFQHGSNIQNLAASVGNYLEITKVRIHRGIDVLPFEELARDFGQEVGLAQRYFSKTYDLETAPGTATLIGMFGVSNHSTGSMQIDRPFPERMRSAPSLIFYDTTGTQNALDSIPGASGLSIFDLLDISEMRWVGGFTGSSFERSGHFTSNAEL